MIGPHTKPFIVRSIPSGPNNISYIVSPPIFLHTLSQNVAFTTKHHVLSPAWCFVVTRFLLRSAHDGWLLSSRAFLPACDDHCWTIFQNLSIRLVCQNTSELSSTFVSRKIRSSQTRVHEGKTQSVTTVCAFCAICNKALTKRFSGLALLSFIRRFRVILLQQCPLMGESVFLIFCMTIKLISIFTKNR